MSSRLKRMKDRLLDAPYEICMARAYHFTCSYRETESLDHNLRNALALKRTLERQKIRIEPDEWIAGSKTEKFLAGPLSVERGDFLRSLEMELESLSFKKRPFLITNEDKELFLREILPYWDGKTLRDRKVKNWIGDGVIEPDSFDLQSLAVDAARSLGAARYLGKDILGKFTGPLTPDRFKPRQLAAMFKLRRELAHNNPTPAAYCFDMQGHLSLGVEKIVTFGTRELVNRIRSRRERLLKENPGDRGGAAFLLACMISLRAAEDYAQRFAELAGGMAADAHDPEEKNRLEMIARHCRHVPGLRPRTFHEAVQSLWFGHLVGEIQYGTHEVFAPGRCDQYLYPFFKEDMAAARITPPAAVELIQELNLKLTANVEPIPEIGSETNGTLGNSQHCVTIGGLTHEGHDAVNELSYLMLEAFEGMGGCLNQLSVRVHDNTPRKFVERAARVFRRSSGISFYGDEAIVPALCADGMKLEHARDYCIVGCIETSGSSDTHGCPGGHELTLPAILMMTLTNGRYPPSMPGQKPPLRTGETESFKTWEQFVGAFRRQLNRQVNILVRAVAAKDLAYRDFLPAPYVSALMDDCVENALDITAGGARYDFTSIALHGLATAADSLLGIRTAVFDQKWVSLPELVDACLKNFKGREKLRKRLIYDIPKFGGDDPAPTRIAIELIGWIWEQACKYTNIRGGKYRLCFYSYGNHVIDGFLLPATTDGRLRGTPISNGISPTNQRDASRGPLPVLRAAASIPPHQVSSGVALNMRFHPSALESDNGLSAFTDMLRTYFKIGGIHIQPNVVSGQTLRDAQRNPDQYKDLVVKVSGYSAYFIDLGASIQDDIIARTEHGGV